MATAELDLASRAIHGDQVALGRLLGDHAAELRIVLDARVPARVRTQTATDDLLQITFADAIHSIRSARFDAPGDFAAWLKRIALHNLDDAIRAFDADKRGGGRAIASLDAHASSQALLADLIAADGPSPSMQVRADEAAGILQAALSELPDDYQTVVRRYDLEGQSIDDVAAAVGRSPGAVHLLRARAFRRLRDSLHCQRTVFRELA
jgi:RNA polymerase sigma-70 factor (subfamily 1)